MAPLFRGVRVCAYVFMCERQKERGSEKLGALWKVCVCVCVLLSALVIFYKPRFCDRLSPRAAWRDKI